VLALRRDVPVIVEAVDAAEAASRWREIADSLAGETDLVHSQAVGRMFAL
jgi:PII-like signaling protein